MKAAKVILDAHPSIYEKGLCLREVGRGTIERGPRKRVDHSTEGSLGGQIEDMASASEEPFVATYGVQEPIIVWRRRSNVDMVVAESGTGRNLKWD